LHRVPDAGFIEVAMSIIFSVNDFKRPSAVFMENHPAFGHDIPPVFDIFRNIFLHDVVKKYKKQNNGFRHHSHTHSVVGAGITIVPAD
jgi:hypothetical protein